MKQLQNASKYKVIDIDKEKIDQDCLDTEASEEKMKQQESMCMLQDVNAQAPHSFINAEEVVKVANNNVKILLRIS